MNWTLHCNIKKKVTKEDYIHQAATSIFDGMNQACHSFDNRSDSTSKGNFLLYKQDMFYYPKSIFRQKHCSFPQFDLSKKQKQVFSACKLLVHYKTEKFVCRCSSRWSYPGVIVQSRQWGEERLQPWWGIERWFFYAFLEALLVHIWRIHWVSSQVQKYSLQQLGGILSYGIHLLSVIEKFSSSTHSLF